MHRARADAALILVTLIWGTTFVIVKNTLDALGPFMLVSARFWTASLILLAVFLLSRVKGERGVVRDGVLTGLLLAGGFITQTLGLQTTEAGKTAFITGLSVVIVPVIAAVVLNKLPTRAALSGVVFAAVGLGLLTLDRSLRLASGDLWVLACAIFFALHILTTGRFAAKYHLVTFTLAQLLTVAVITLLAAVCFESDSLLLAPRALPAIVYLGVVATAAVFGLQTWSQRHTTPTHTALIFTLEPVFAALFALVFAGESLILREWIGGGMILVGMLVAELGDGVWTI